ncbi:MAG: hypothetical protein AAB661_02705, partial [Patescibacteria group bacterium]
DYAALVVPAIKGIQELNLRVEGLDERIAALGGLPQQEGSVGIGLFNSIMAQFKDIYGVIWENGVLKIANVISDKLTTKELCIEEVCVNKAQLQELLNKNNINNNSTGAVINNTGGNMESAVEENTVGQITENQTTATASEDTIETSNTTATDTVTETTNTNTDSGIVAELPAEPAPASSPEANP